MVIVGSLPGGVPEGEGSGLSARIVDNAASGLPVGRSVSDIEDAPYAYTGGSTDLDLQ